MTDPIALRNQDADTKPAVMLHHSGTVVTFAELDDSANRLAHFLRGVGLVAADTIAILMENNEHVHTAMWAARRCGLYYTVVNTHLSAAEIAHIVSDSGAQRAARRRVDRRRRSRGLAALSGVCAQRTGDAGRG